ncbi:TOM1-like protein 6 [Oryza brachyantha]|uniref:TOM1-like protein 6 n=1 Tax=Oryza brachyantha TaxID=4533 RepID=UPI001ADC3E94|nr:TOM1-like protein 6 [Oryza brachyantha]
MYPVVTGPPPARLPASSRVDKATSHLLQGPDWAINLEICDTLNADRWQTKDVVKALKKRLQHRDPRVQFLTLTLLETVMKNCGEYVHFEVIEQNILQEMVKIVQKKHDMQVRDKVLVLLDSWQEAFGGPGGKYPQYYWSYIELKRSGIMFPRRPLDAPPIFTPPATRHAQPYGSPTYPAGSLNERMASDVETLSLGDLNNIRDTTELLCDMVNALNPSDRMAVKDEIITELVSQCRSNQQKLMRFVSSTGNEELLKQGLEINDRLQGILAKHDAIAAGSPLPVETPRRDEIPREDPKVKSSAPPIVPPSAPPVEEDEDDEFAQIARRKNKSVIDSNEASSSAGDQALVPVDPATSETSSSVASNAMVPVDSSPASGTRTKEQDMIDLLSLTLYTPPEASTGSSSQSQNSTQQPVMSNGPELPPNYQPAASNGSHYSSNQQAHPTNQAYTPYNNYVAPWAQTGQGTQAGAYQPQPMQYASSYPAPPWAMPASVNSTNPFQPATYRTQNPPVTSAAPTNTYPTPSSPYAAPPRQHVPSPTRPMQATQQNSSFGSQTRNGPAMAQDARMNGTLRQPEAPAAAAKPYYMPDNLFGDLIDVKSFGGGKMSRTTSMPSPNGSSQPLLGGKK